jgi:hypothetical protein
VLKFQMTMRTLMGIVAVAALLFGVERLLSRRARFLELAEAHASRVLDYGVNRDEQCFKDEFRDANGLLREDFCKQLDICCDHWAALERKYRYAANHPWLAVEPDPPSP